MVRVRVSESYIISLGISGGMLRFYGSVLGTLITNALVSLWALTYRSNSATIVGFIGSVLDYEEIVTPRSVNCRRTPPMESHAA